MQPPRALVSIAIALITAVASGCGAAGTTAAPTAGPGSSDGAAEIEGVNYPQLTVVLVNALRQHEARLRREIEALKALVCAANPRSAPCVEGAPAP